MLCIIQFALMTDYYQVKMLQNVISHNIYHNKIIFIALNNVGPVILFTTQLCC